MATYNDNISNNVHLYVGVDYGFAHVKYKGTQLKK